MRTMRLTVSLLAVWSVAQGAAAAAEKPKVRDLSGEWAVEWFDPKADYRETVFFNLTLDDAVLAGTGLDPQLIPSVIEGSVKGDEIEFACKPSRDPLPFRAPPFSTFTGKVTQDDALEGTWQLDRRESAFSGRRKGTWTAKRTRTDGRSTVTLARKTEIIVKTTSAEYDLLCYVGPSPTQWQLDNKESKRRGDDYEVSQWAGLLIRDYDANVELAAMEKRSKPETTKQRLALCEKIKSTLRENGYPWKLDKNSRTLVEPN